MVRLEAHGARMVVWRTFPADVGHDTTTSQYACAPLHVNEQKTHVIQQSQPHTTIRASVLSKHHTASTRTAHALTRRTNDAKEQPSYSTARATWTTFDDGDVFGRRTEQEVRAMRRMYPARHGDDLNNVETRKRATVDEGGMLKSERTTMPHVHQPPNNTQKNSEFDINNVHLEASPQKTDQ